MTDVSDSVSYLEFLFIRTKCFVLRDLLAFLSLLTGCIYQIKKKKKKAAYQVSSLGPRETHHHRVKWLEPYHPYACGHEILWVTGIEKFEGHHRPPAVCLLSKEVSRQCSHFGTALHPANSILFVDFSSAFNTINPVIIHQKLTLLIGPRFTYQWLTSFQSDRHK